MFSRLLSYSLAIPSIATLAAADCPTATQGGGFVKPATLPELSGCAASLRNPGVVYGHNDKIHSPRIYAFEPGGRLRSTISLGFATTLDWADMDVAEVGGTSYVYVADTGDKHGGRDEVAVFRFPEPALPVSNQTISPKVYNAFRIVYSDGPQDVQAMAIDSATGEIVLAARDRTGSDVTRVYTVVPNFDGTLAIANPITEILDLPGDFATTGADWSASGHLALLQHSLETGGTHVLLWDALPGTPLATVMASPPCDLTLQNMAQAEALCFFRRSLLVGGEGDVDPLQLVFLGGATSDAWIVE